MDRLVLFVVVFILMIFLIRLFGAWMLRINDVISELKGLRSDLARLNLVFSKDLEEEKVCPMCAENVKSKAKICKHCGYKFPVPKAEESIGIVNEADMQKLKEKLKDDEIIIQMKETKELKVIKKEEYKTDKELLITDTYKVIYKNEK